MKMFNLVSAAALAVATVTAAPAFAQASGVAVADPQAAIAGTKAWQAARTQIQTTYKAQLDTAEARRQAIGRELQPLVTAFETARAAPNANQQALQTQANTIQQRERTAQQELERLLQPATRAQQYAIEQIQAKLGDAVTAATRARNVQLLVSPQAVLFMQPAADITSVVTTELDRLVPSVSIAVPANWQPGQQQQAGAAPAAGTPARAPATPARTPAGR
jgi:Skp family chaperone for outer membrane proteins